MLKTEQDIQNLEMKKEKLHKIFLQGYHDGLEQLQDLVDKKTK